MISIGEFARLGRVSVRMLRHYDAIGLLCPQCTDPRTGYRYYADDQLRRLNRIVALKELGLRLEQVAHIVDERLDADQLRTMLRLRQAELESQISESRQRLDRVMARLRLIDCEESMSRSDISTKTVEPVTTVGLRELAESATQEDVGPVITAMYPTIMARFAQAGVHPVGPSIAYYTPAPERSEDALWVHATFPASSDTVEGLQTVEIPAARVASLIYQGSMAGVDEAYQSLHRWVRENGHTATGGAREVYLETPDDHAQWVTEVQLELAD